MPIARPLLFPLLVLGLVGPVAPAGAADLDMNEVFDSFYKVDLAEGAIPVKDLVLKRPDFELKLISGAFVPARGLAGQPSGGVFLGEGEVRFRPSQEMDRRILNRRLNEWLKKSGVEYKSKITSAVLRFSDDTLAQLGEAGESNVDRERATDVWTERNQILSNIEKLSLFSFNQFALEMDFLQRVMNGLEGNAFFVADLETAEDGWLLYVNNDNYIEEVYFGQRKSLGAQEEMHPFAVTNRAEDFDKEGHYVSEIEDDDKLTFDTDHYRLGVTIPDTLRVLMEASIDITPRVALTVVRFSLVNSVRAAKWTDRGLPIDVTKVTDEAGNELPFLHKRHEILIEFPEPLPPGSTAVVNVSAEERTIVQEMPESYELLNTYPWFPQSGFAGGRNTHEWTVKIKKPLVAVVSGRLVNEWEENDLNCSAWVMDEEVQFPSLLFGKFATEEFSYTSDLTGDEISIRVYAIPQGTINGISYAGVKRMKPVALEAMEIIKLFEALYGPYPYDYLNVAQMAIGKGFGQAPPGLVQLTGEAFMSSATIAAVEGRGDFFHEFFSHEIAHQWWAHVVWGSSFRDAWLSESFAEYSAGLYWQQYGGGTAFQNKLKDWRQNAAMARGSAPIAALATLSGDLAGQYYTQQIYNKGPYVLHMLRMQMGHEKWVAGMQSFFKKYRHTNLTTEKFMAEMEQAAGYKMDFFFDQWWKGTGIPSFAFTYDVKPAEDGRYLFTGTITQEDTDFKVMMPIFFHFGGDEVSIQNRPIVSSPDVYQAMLPKEPKNVTLDDFNTLLADIQSGDTSGGSGDKKGKGKGKKGSQ